MSLCTELCPQVQEGAVDWPDRLGAGRTVEMGGWDNSKQKVFSFSILTESVRDLDSVLTDVLGFHVCLFVFQPLASRGTQRCNNGKLWHHKVF